MESVNNVVNVPVESRLQFYSYWLHFIKPFHKLTNKEIEILSYFLYYRDDLLKTTGSDKELYKKLFSEEIRSKVIEGCGISKSHLQVALVSLRKAGVIVNKELNPKFIPRVIEGDTTYKLLFYFDLKWIQEKHQE